jgi:hypothetical protein
MNDMNTVANAVGWITIGILVSACSIWAINFFRRACFGLMLGWAWRQERKGLIAQGIIKEERIC